MRLHKPALTMKEAASVIAGVTGDSKRESLPNIVYVLPEFVGP